MSLLEFAATVAARGVSLEFTVADGETLALLGPNGAGKSTVLSVIAGLVAPSEGSVHLGGRDVGRLRPHERRVALLAQDPALFPHLTALDNVAFGPRSAGASRKDSRDLARRLLADVGVSDLAGRKPHQLSGGQAQRVAIARALVTAPDVLLLDEPMAALDVAVTPALRQLLRTVLADRTAIIVTHDALDALLLADRVLVMEGGRVAEYGPVGEVLARPRSAFAARIAGLNLVAGRWIDSAVVHPDATVTGMTTEPGPMEGGDAIAVFSPAAVAVYRQAPHGSPRNCLGATVTDLEPLGDRIRLHAQAGSLALAAEITTAATAELGLGPGAPVYLSVKATEVTIYAAGRPGMAAR
jgi:molybdopterin-binding protein